MCPRCEKPQELCVCEGVLPVDTRLKVVILQHPQEPDKKLGTARLAQLALRKATLKVGLSWPNLKIALRSDPTTAASEAPIPGHWAVLYLGSGIRSESGAPETRPGLYFVDKRGSLKPDQQTIAKNLEGIILLDGTWSQAKTLWWRNAWLLKAQRAILVPKNKSLYGLLRKEPRRECLSTIETIAEALEALGEAPTVAQELRGHFSRLLSRYRDARKG